MSRRLPLKSSAGLGNPARTLQSASGISMADAVVGTGIPVGNRLLYMHTVYSRRQIRTMASCVTSIAHLAPLT